jgi:hypothetical protein
MKLTREQIESEVQRVLDWCAPGLTPQQLRPDLAYHISEAIMVAEMEASGELTALHAAGKYWNASSGQFDDGGCW